MTASGSGASNAFTLASGSNSLAYSVFYNDASSTTGEAAVTAGTVLSGQSGANTTSVNCGGGSNANFHVRIAESNLLAAPAGAYTGILTLFVEPV